MNNSKNESSHESYYTESQQLVLCVYLGVFVIPTAVIMNTLMIVAFVKYKKLRIPGMYFILNIAFSNLLATCVSAPLIIASILNEQIINGVLNESNVCSFRAMVDNTLLCISALSLAISSMDRCWAVWRPFSYHKMMTTKKATLCLFVMWVACIIYNMPMAIHHPKKKWAMYTFSWISYTCGMNILDFYPLIYFFMVLFIPVIVTCCSYSIIFYAAVKSINSTPMRPTKTSYVAVDSSDRSRRTLKSALRTLVLVGIFAITMLPTLVISVMFWVEMNIIKISKEEFRTQLKQLLAFLKVLSWLTYSSYALNPIVYGLMDTNFRSAYKSFLRCTCTDEFRKRAQKQFYSDLANERRRSTNKTYLSRYTDCCPEQTQTMTLTELRSANGSVTPATPGSANGSVTPVTPGSVNGYHSNSSNSFTAQQT